MRFERSFLIFGIMVFRAVCFAQVQTIPYYNLFDFPADTVGWTHSAGLGIDDWELGAPIGNAYSLPNAWVTDLDGSSEDYSDRSLISPVFDFSSMGTNYVLEFYQKRSGSSSPSWDVEYSTDNGVSWNILYDAVLPKKNWQSATGYSSSTGVPWVQSCFALDQLIGQDSVRFRFQFEANNTSSFGWIIDNFSIHEEYFNITSNSGDTIYSSPNCDQLEVIIDLYFANQYSSYVNNKTDYYFSYDLVLDGSDLFLGSKSDNILGDELDWPQVFPMIPNLSAGNYYILMQHETNNLLVENDEADNLAHVVLHMDSVFATPFHDDLENSFEPYKNYREFSTDDSYWALGSGYYHHTEHSHSGNKSLHTNEGKYCSGFCSGHVVELPNFDMTTDGPDQVLNFWFKNPTTSNNFTVQYSSNCGDNWYFLDTIPEGRDDEWDFINVNVSAFVANDNMKFRIRQQSGSVEGINVDDFYVGAKRPDLSIQRDLLNHYTVSSSVNDTLVYFLNNSGLAAAPSTTTTFYWSTDSLYDLSDIPLGSKVESVMADTARIWTEFGFIKPTVAEGKYYIFYFLDTAEIVNEMREYDNAGYFVIYQNVPKAFPYLNDFETQVDGWRHNATLGQDDWEWTEPNGTVLDSAFSGTKVWITNDTGWVSPWSRMHLYTPVFDLTTATAPVIEFDMIMHGQPTCECSEGKSNMSYSIDGGATWQILDTANQSFNSWYYPTDYSFGGGTDNLYYIPNNSKLLFDDEERAFTAWNQYNSRDAVRNTRYILDVSFLAGKNVQFRYNLATQQNNLTSPNYPVEGILLDNFSVREAFIDLSHPYEKALMLSSLTQELKVTANFKNIGNYISQPCDVNFYASVDTILDGSDVIIGSDSIGFIRPDLLYYMNSILPAPPNFSSYNFLILEIDPGNVNLESNELNNVTSWPFAFDSISIFPYSNDFSDTILNGWTSYLKEYYTGEQVKFKWRFRNFPVVAEYLYQSDIESNQIFTDRIYSVMNISQVPVFYIETPAFNFSTVDSVEFNFNLMCVGNAGFGQEEGGNLQFSLDGGVSWTVLTSAHAQVSNWYNISTTDELYDQPSWAENAYSYSVAMLEPRSFKTTYFAGKPSVLFRFQYRSNQVNYGEGTPQGMRIGGFEAYGFEADYAATDSMTAISVIASQTSTNLNYHILNQGETNGKPTVTHFYWSEDAFFDGSDTYLMSKNNAAIGQGIEAVFTATVNFPVALSQDFYYVFYYVDADSVISEVSEMNNLGSFKLVIQPYYNYNTMVQMDTVQATLGNPDISVAYKIINNGTLDGVTTETAFYWSQDNIFSGTDPLLFTVSEPIISMGDTLASYILLSYPVPVTQEFYYVFYAADDVNVMSELYENENINSVVVDFDAVTGIRQDNIDQYILYTDGNALYLRCMSNIIHEKSVLNFYDVSGKIIWSQEIVISNGLNVFDIPFPISSGIYLAEIKNEIQSFSSKIVLTRN